MSKLKSSFVLLFPRVQLVSGLFITIFLFPQCYERAALWPQRSGHSPTRFFSGGADTVLSSATSALQAAVPGAMGADQHPAVPGDTASLVSVSGYSPAAMEQLTHSPHEKNTGFLLHGNHFMVFHQKTAFLRTPTVARTDPAAT